MSITDSTSELLLIINLARRHKMHIMENIMTLQHTVYIAFAQLPSTAGLPQGEPPRDAVVVEIEGVELSWVIITNFSKLVLISCACVI